MSRLGSRLSSCIVLPVAAACFCLFGGVFVAISAGNLQDYYASESWKTTSGVVISSQVQTNRDSDGSDTYRAHITYEYTANDRRYTHDRLQFGDDIYSSGKSGKEKKVAEYPPGREIIVYYDPENPQSAVVERELTTGIKIFTAIGLCIMGIGVLILLSAPVILLRSFL